MHDPEADITTEEPAAPMAGDPPAKRWSMPEPVFQQTSGYLPQGYEKRFPAPPAAANDAVSPAPEDPFARTYVGAPPTAEDPFLNTHVGAPLALETESVAAAGNAGSAAVAEAAPIEEQPDISEHLVTDPDEVAAPQAAAPKQRSAAARYLTIGLMIVAIAAFVVIFLAVIFYLFQDRIIGATPDL